MSPPPPPSKRETLDCKQWGRREIILKVDIIVVNSFVQHSILKCCKKYKENLKYKPTDEDDPEAHFTTNNKHDFFNDQVACVRCSVLIDQAWIDQIEMSGRPF